MPNKINNFQLLAEAVIEESAENQGFREEVLTRLKEKFSIPINDFLEESFFDQIFNDSEKDNLDLLISYYGKILEKFLKNGLVKDSKKLFGQNIEQLFIASADEIKEEFIKFTQDELSSLVITSENIIFLKYFLKNKKNLEAKDFAKILEAAGGLSSYQKKSLIKNYLEKAKEKNKEITVEVFAKILEAARNLSSNDKEPLIKYYLETAEEKKQEITVEDFAKILEASENLDYYKKSLIEDYLEKSEEKNWAITAEGFIKILEAAGDLNSSDRNSLIKDFLSEKPNQKKLEYLITILNNPMLLVEQGIAVKFQIDKVAKIYLDIFRATNQNTTQTFQSPEINHLEQLITLAKNLHPNSEELQFDLLQEAIKNGYLITKDQLFSTIQLQNLTNPNQLEQSSNQVISLVMSNSSQKNISPVLLKFINETQNDDLVIKLGESLQNRKLLENEEKILLQLVKGRTAARFEFIKEIFEKETGNKNLSEFLTKEGFEYLKGLFGEDYLIQNDIGILDIISYYDIQQILPEVLEILKPSFKEKLQTNLKPSKDVLLIKPEEITKLITITGLEENKIKEKLIQNLVLCQYFENKLEIKPLNKEQLNDYKINFQNFDLIDEDKQKEFGEEFKKILIKENLSADEVFKTFSLIIPDANSINTDNQNKLLEFFIKSKNEIAHLFSKESGLANFIACLNTLADGCAANIGAQFNIALHGALLEKPQDQILYPIITQNIIPEILNKHGGDVIGSNSNPLKNDIIQNYFVSPKLCLIKFVILLLAMKKIQKELILGSLLKIF